MFVSATRAHHRLEEKEGNEEEDNNDFEEK
jgi:hypothetical protein